MLWPGAHSRRSNCDNSQEQQLYSYVGKIGAERVQPTFPFHAKRGGREHSGDPFLILPGEADRCGSKKFLHAIVLFRFASLTFATSNQFLEQFFMVFRPIVAPVRFFTENHRYCLILCSFWSAMSVFRMHFRHFRTNLCAWLFLGCHVLLIFLSCDLCTCSLFSHFTLILFVRSYEECCSIWFRANGKYSKGVVQPKITLFDK